MGQLALMSTPLPPTNLKQTDSSSKVSCYNGKHLGKEKWTDRTNTLPTCHGLGGSCSHQPAFLDILSRMFAA